MSCSMNILDTAPPTTSLSKELIAKLTVLVESVGLGLRDVDDIEDVGRFLEDHVHFL